MEDGVKKSVVGLFEDQWQTYRTVIDSDWMEHRGVTNTTAKALDAWFSDHPDRHGQARFLDLGCGDLAQLAPIIRRLPLGGYVGVDLTEQVLPLARAALGQVPFTTQLHHSDVQTFVDAEDGQFDLVHASFVLHHLEDKAKEDLLTALRRRVTPHSAFLWTDVFREPGETRSDYLHRYCARIRRDWNAITVAAREAIVAHITAYDFPPDRNTIVTTAARAGWHWRWLWQGSHQAEAVALLTPSATN